jgi:P4 family phage/plasmid primase-like protien
MDQYLKGVSTTKEQNNYNYTKIGCPKLNIFGGLYYIPEEETEKFYNVYKQHIFVDGKQAYITEKQLVEGQILIDVDFKYSVDIDSRQHTKNHIIDLINCILEIINKIKQNNGETLSCYIFEKDSVNMEEAQTKDGIHIIINLRMDYKCKSILRKYLIEEMQEIWSDLPITNSWQDVFDNSVMSGGTGWQMFGSRKPGHQDYKLKYVFNCVYTTAWKVEEQKINLQWVKDNFKKLLARNTDIVNMELNPNIQKEYDATILQNKNPNKTNNIVKVISNISNMKNQYDIKNVEELNEYIDDFMFNLTPTEYMLKEAHEYSMLLPQDYWGPGSYSKWIRVGWALKNTDNRLFITWAKFSSQSATFDFSQIGDLYEKWCNFDMSNKEGLTIKSIIYWCKMSNEEEYKKIYNKTVQHYVYYSIKNSTDYDLANVLYQLYKESYVCAHIKNNVWYEFINNRWVEIDCGQSLRSKISLEMHEIYHKESLKQQQNKFISEAPTLGEVPKNFNDDKELLESIGKTAKKLKTSGNKNTIMNEAKEIFYDNVFCSKLNTDNYLFGCNNCIIDLKNKSYRKGKHDDYISKSCDLDYKPIEYYRKHSPKLIDEIKTFISQIFPADKQTSSNELEEYMWQYMSSLLFGTNENQTLNIFIGSGANGKSMLIDLLSKVLGKYKGTVPISLITQKRGNIGGTSSEVYQLIGTRFAVMQEPSLDDEINAGIVKELTGSDPIMCRELFQTSTVFIPQFKLALATNRLPKIKDRDDGIWRRMRVVEFRTKFTENPYKDPQFPEDQYPYQYPMDSKIKDKFDDWAPVLLSMLVEYAYKFQGKVHNCASVMNASNKYREDQNIYLEYSNERIIKEPTISGSRLKITTIQDDFKEWYKSHYDKKDIPIKELKEYLINKFGKYPPNGWSHISLSEEDI